MPGRCADRGESFLAQKEWHWRCWSCWHRAERRREGDAHERGWRQAHREMAETLAAATVDLSDDLLRRCVRLCHPDAHPPDRAAQAHAATCDLLAVLDARRTRARRAA